MHCTAICASRVFMGLRPRTNIIWFWVRNRVGNWADTLQVAYAFRYKCKSFGHRPDWNLPYLAIPTHNTPLLTTDSQLRFEKFCHNHKQGIYVQFFKQVKIVISLSQWKYTCRYYISCFTYAIFILHTYTLTKCKYRLLTEFSLSNDVTLTSTKSRYKIFSTQISKQMFLYHFLCSNNHIPRTE